MESKFKIESLLSVRLFMNPQLVGERIFFVSDLSGRLSLYVMDKGGSVPEPLLPPDLALQNPTLVGGELFHVLPKLGKVLVMIDRDGDELYQPCFIPMDGGYPEPIFGARFAGYRLFCSQCDPDQNLATFQAFPPDTQQQYAHLTNLETGEMTELGSSLYGNWVVGANRDFSQLILMDGYTMGDHVLYRWRAGATGRELLYGKPLDARAPDEVVPPNAIFDCHFTAGDRGLLFVTALFQDDYGLGYLDLHNPSEVQPVTISGVIHSGVGELSHLEHLSGSRYLLTYNIDGCSFAYEGVFDEPARSFTIDKSICGVGILSNGVLQHLHYDKGSGDYAVSFSTATSPAQIYTIEGDDRRVMQHTRERILGVPQHLLAAGEDASFVSHDGLRISARLYMPSPEVGYTGKRPVVFYIHGGPQSQERPDFTWFSMPLIQFFTLNGFAVFVPNVRGSTGYGLDYMKRVDRDWGGQDRLDHVAAHQHLRQDARLDMERAGVMGRSYGGYMTLMLAGRHPELWRAACDMFGPYNLLTFQERIPETWKPYMYMAVGHPEKDKEFLVDRSPSTHLHNLACPLLVIQGRNDPRVREAESSDLVEQLRAQGKEVEYIVFENEGHDILKFENKVRCYNAIVDFFRRHLSVDA